MGRDSKNHTPTLDIEPNKLMPTMSLLFIFLSYSGTFTFYLQ